MPNSHQNVQNLGANGLYGTNTVYGGGGVPVARGDLDFLRLGVGRVPSAEYPDGYLGTIRSRRDDRGRPSSTSDTVLNSMKQRLGQRGYQRGVHRGERIDPSDYFYPSQLDPQRGLKRQMKAEHDGNVWMSPRYVENQMLVPAPHLPNDGKAGPSVRSDSPYSMDAKRVSQLSNMRPAWR
jgi:hypothetical protein